MSAEHTTKYVITGDEFNGIDVKSNGNSFNDNKKWSSKIKSEVCTTKEKEGDYVNTNLKAS